MGGCDGRKSNSLSPCYSHPNKGAYLLFGEPSALCQLLTYFEGLEARNDTCVGDPDSTPLTLIPVHPDSVSGVPHLTRPAAYRSEGTCLLQTNAGCSAAHATSAKIPAPLQPAAGYCLGPPVGHFEIGGRGQGLSLENWYLGQEFLAQKQIEAMLPR